MRTAIRLGASSIASILLFAAGCEPARSAPKGDEEDAPLDGAFDSFRSPIDHGGLTFGIPVEEELTRDESFHAWTFELTGAADVALHTAPTRSNREVDTMLYLYREGPRGWGSYLTRNDDTGGTLFSAISRSLTAGRYRVLVKGYTRSSVGPFVLHSACDGAGCPATPPVGECLFGGTYREMRDSAAFEPELSTIVTADTVGSLAPAHAAQLLTAVQVAYEDATDLASAFASVDQNEVNVLVVREVATGRRFRAYEYGAGDNSYGAIFEGDSPVIGAEINDGDLYECVVLGAPQGARIGADCGEGSMCATGLVCQGFVEERGLGKCAPMDRIAGEGEQCSATDACPGDMLICAGLTRGDAGICLPTWLRGSIGEGWGFEIPDGPGGELTRSETMYGLATVDMDVEIRALIQHPRHADLRITLTNPVGTEVVVFDGVPGSGALELDGPVFGFSGDESVNGTWALRIVDRRSGSVGTLERWAVDVMSRWD